MVTGIQISSLKPLLLTTDQVRECFAKVKNLGCDLVQLQWVDPSVPLEVIGKSLEENQIRSVSVQDFYETVMGDLDYFVNLIIILYTTFLVTKRVKFHYFTLFRFKII